MDDLKTQAKHCFNLDLSDAVLAALETYAAQIIEWNKRINLTSINDPHEIRIRHFLDSLSLLQIPDLPPQVHLIDVGSGAGLPGLVLKIARPEWHVTLIDATAKKVNFLKHVIADLMLENTVAQQFRAEEAGQALQHCAHYDVVVARAVARLPILIEYMLPLCKIGGLCVAFKGETAHHEAAEAAFATSTLGGKLEQIVEVAICCGWRTKRVLDCGRCWAWRLCRC